MKVLFKVDFKFLIQEFKKENPLMDDFILNVMKNWI